MMLVTVSRCSQGVEEDLEPPLPMLFCLAKERMREPLTKLSWVELIIIKQSKVEDFRTQEKRGASSKYNKD